MRKKLLPKGMVDQQTIKPARNPTQRNDSGKQFLTNLIYMVPLRKVLGMILPFYWNPGKTIIDSTCGKKISWETFPYNHKMFNGKIAWDITFNDIDETIDADYHEPAQNIDYLGRFDILFNDFPFIELKNGLESFGTKKKIDRLRKEKSLGRRDQYFNQYRPLHKLFLECVDSWNLVTDNLVIKIGDSHKNYEQIPNHVYAIQALDNRFNSKSQFHLMDIIHYRGVYSSRGGRFPFAQSVISQYLIFKKNLKSR